MTTRIQDKSPEVQEMASEWPVIHALMGGTRAMREASKTLLPKWPNEEQGSYNSRLSTATLYPAFNRTVGVMAGKPFSKQLVLSDDVPPQVSELLEDCDLEGRNLHAFASELMEYVLAYGFEGVLVDYPNTSGQVATLADQQRIGARPYLVFIKHSQILGWKTERIGGVRTLTQLRLLEQVDDDDDDYAPGKVTQVRLFEPGRWATYRADAKGDYHLYEEGTTTLNAIPFVPFYGRRCHYMEGKSPLTDLAYLNVKHWQSQSDQDTLMHVARVPILFMKGFPETATVVVGASAAVKSDSGDADIKYVEHSGAAIGAGRDALKDLEQQMLQIGAELLVSRNKPNKTATESNNEAEANKSELQRIVETFEDSLDQVLQFMAAWLGLPDGGHVSLFKDFGSSDLSDASAQLVLAMQGAGLITKETAIREQQRRGILAVEIDPVAELEAVSTEGPALGTMGA